MTSLVDTVLKVVTEVTGLTVEDVTSKCRNADYVIARHLAVWYCVKTGVPTSVVAKRFGIARYSVNRIVTDHYKHCSTHFHDINCDIYNALDELGKIAHK